MFSEEPLFLDEVRCVMLRAFVLLCAAVVFSSSALGEEPSLEQWLSDDFALDEWSSEPSPALAGDDLIYDPNVEPIQAQAPAIGPRSARQPVQFRRTAMRRAGMGVAIGGIASVPYTIGDTGAGTCLDFTGLVEATLAHPSLTCGRLNVSEANSPLPTDRVYYSYRHFHNAGGIAVYQFSEILDLDQHTIAWENAFWDRTGSLEVRVPIEQRMRSDIFSIIAPNFGIVDPLVAPGDGRRAELGNIALVFKMLLWERPTHAISGGIGVTLPTGSDVDYRLAVDGEVAFPNMPGITADEAVAFQAVFGSETMYLAPYLAWIVAPTSRWFHQGFLQVEVAANPSGVTVFGDGATLFLDNGTPIGFYDYFTPIPVRAKLFAQTLMRLNLGAGYIISESMRGDRLSQIAALFEMHYTTTLSDANLSEIPLTTQSSVGTVPLQSISVGNADPRGDVLNAAAEELRLLVAEETATPRHERDLAAALRAGGEALVALDRRDEGRTRMDESQVILNRLVREHPGEEDYAAELQRTRAALASLDAI